MPGVAEINVTGLHGAPPPRGIIVIMVTPGRLRLHPSEVDRRSRALLDKLARLRKVDRRHAELSAEQRSLVRDRNTEVAQRDAARALLTAGHHHGWQRPDTPRPTPMDSADAISRIRCAEIMIGTLNKILVQNRKHLSHLESIRRALRLMVKKP
jgi:hypothetical protein